MPVRMLQELDYLGGEWGWLTSINKIATARHDFIPHDLFAIAELFNKVAQKGGKVDF